MTEDHEDRIAAERSEESARRRSDGDGLAAPRADLGLDLGRELEEIRAAAARLAPHVRETPTVYSYTFSEATGADVHLKLREPPAHGLVQGARRAQQDPPASGGGAGLGLVAAVGGEPRAGRRPARPGSQAARRRS